MKTPEFFRFTRTERRGMVALLLLCGGYLILRPFLFEDKVDWPEVKITASESKPSYAEKEGEWTSAQPSHSGQDFEREESRFVALGRKFDPDTMSVDGWADLGLSSKQAAALVNYGQKLGGFDDVEAFRSSFVVSDEFYRVIATDLEFSHDDGEEVVSKEERSSTEEIKVRDINKASTDDLMTVRGIGETLSKRIIKFRSVLGGFNDLDQLSEVYGLEKEVIEEIEARFELLSPVRKININEATEEQLYGHPYFRDGLSGAIVEERNKNGKYQRVEDVRRVYLIDEEMYEKILPYITTNDE